MMFFHLTEKNLGEHPILIPKKPRERMINESEIIRICVSDSLMGCLEALINTTYKPEYWNVYVTNDDPVDSINVPDYKFTNEKWYLTPKKFYHAGQVEANLRDMGFDARFQIQEKKIIENAQKILRGI